jgi:hypothetical protein
VPRRRFSSRVSASDAQQLLQDLVREGRISTADIHRIREIRQLEERLEALRGGAGGQRGGRRGATAQVGGKRRRSRITAQQLASRQLQGRYLGLIRQIPASQRPRYAKVARDRGREAAIKEMQSALNK